MHNTYKPSMFNRIVKEKDDIVLYNSFKGTKGLLIIKKNKVEKVIQWLGNKQGLYYDDEDFSILVEMGFLVPADVDEKVARLIRYQNYTSDNRLNLVIHTTKACNFRCSYCYMDFKNEKMEEDIQIGVVNYIRKNIQKYKSVQISWFGGEPLLGLDVIENISKPILEICKNQKKPYTSMITTNGYLLTPENVKKLLDCHVNHIAVTIDGNKELHDKQRMLVNGMPTFECIINNLLYIKKHVRSCTLTVSIRNNITINHVTILQEYYDYYNKNFGDDSRFSLFVRPVADYGGKRVEAMKNLFINDMSGVYRQLSNIQDGVKFYPNLIDLEVGGSTCNARNLNKYTIGCNGNVSKCDEDLNTPIGKLYKNGRMEINEYKHIQWLNCVQKNICENCFFSGSCFMGICPKAKISSSNEKCTVNYDEVDALILLAAKSYVCNVL